MDIPEFFQGPAYYDQSQFTQESRRLSDAKSSFVDEFLNYPNDDGLVAPAVDHHDGGGVFEDHMLVAGAGGGAVTGTSTHESTFLDSTSCNSTGSTGLYPFGGDNIAGCRNFTDAHFSSELCVPYDDLAELEWVSHFAEESFSCEDLQNMHLISGIESPNNNNNTEFQPEPNRATSTSISTTIFRPEMAVPAKARSKRSRAPPCNWTSRLLAVTPSPSSSTTTNTTTTTDQMTSTIMSSSESIGSSLEKKAMKATLKKKESARNGMVTNSEGRRCLHCATDQTPQWRTGPMGPKTLCNACGVRYKSGRLLPEYRLLASPTFVLTKHSNSHRKVMELRRQNEVSTVHQHQHQHQHHHQQQFLHHNMMFNVANVDDFLIHQHIGPDFRQLI